MGMNQKTAFKILGLGPGASLEQVKKAFRDLAKQYHPDRFSSDRSSSDRSPSGENGPARAEFRLNRMKEINRAFHFLLPLFPPTDALTDNKASSDKPPSSMKPKPPSDKDSGNKVSSFLEIIGMFKKGLKFYRKPGSPPRPFVQPPLKPSAPQQNSSGKTARFSAILNTLHPDGPYDKKSTDCGRDCKIPSRDSRGRVRASGNHPYSSFLKYMALKKQIDARRRPRGEQNCSRIEKIQPVTRVTPIGNKHKS